MKRIKNNTGGLKTYLGQDIAAGEYYTLQDRQEEQRWSCNSILIADIESGDAIVNDGTDDITNAILAKAFLAAKPKVITSLYTFTPYLITGTDWESIASVPWVKDRNRNYAGNVFIFEIGLLSGVVKVRLCSPPNNEIWISDDIDTEGIKINTMSTVPSNDASLELQVKKVSGTEGIIGSAIIESYIE